METYNDNGVKVVKVATRLKIRSQPISFELVKKIKELSKDVDIIHLHFPNPLAEFALLKANVDKKIIITYHSDITKQKILFQAYKPFLKKLFNKAEAIIATTQKYADSSPILPTFKNKIKIIPLGIEPEEFKYQSPTKIKKISSKYGPKIVLFVGRLVQFKGVKYLIEALKKCPDVNLIIIGSGEEENNLKKLKDKLHLKNVFFIEHINNKKELINYYKASNIVIFPSISRNESFGIVQLEAMICKKPVICTEINSGTTYVNIHNKTGIVIKPKDSVAIANAIQLLFKNPKLIEQYGTNAQNRVLKLFTVKINKEKNIELYREVLKK
jgi:rhamnosyl/mannosyltransferase